MKRLEVNLVKILACTKAAVSRKFLMSTDDPVRRTKSGKIKINDVKNIVGDLLGNPTKLNCIAHNRPCSSY